MKRLIFIAILFLTGCNTIAVLEKEDYDVVDTIKVNQNGFNAVLSYDVIIRLKEDSTLHYGCIRANGILTQANIKPIKIK